VRDFWEGFHDEQLALQRPAREEQKSFIVAGSTGVRRLQDVQAGLVGRVAQSIELKGNPNPLPRWTKTRRSSKVISAVSWSRPTPFAARRSPKRRRSLRKASRLGSTDLYRIKQSLRFTD